MAGDGLEIRTSVEEGDPVAVLRDWAAVRTWSEGIAQEMAATSPSVPAQT